MVKAFMQKPRKSLWAQADFKRHYGGSETRVREGKLHQRGSMLVDDAHVFDEPVMRLNGSHQPLVRAQSAGLASSVSLSRTPSMGGFSAGARIAQQSTAASLVEQRAMADVVLYRNSTGRHSASIQNLLAASRDDEDESFTVTEHTPHLLGYYASHGPEISWTARERLRSSLERDAPADVLDDIRALARQPGQTGISAFKLYCDAERRQSRSNRQISFSLPTSLPAWHPPGMRTP